MKIRLVDGVEVHRGSVNVVADLGLADADKLKIKTGLVLGIRNPQDFWNIDCYGNWGQVRN